MRLPEIDVKNKIRLNINEITTADNNLLLNLTQAITLTITAVPRSQETIVTSSGQFRKEHILFHYFLTPPTLHQLSLYLQHLRYDLDSSSILEAGSE